MFIVDTWQDVALAHEEAGRPLAQDVLDDLFDVAADPRAKDCQWAVFVAVCRICMHEELVIVPFLPEADLDDLECLNCNNDTMMEKELEEWQM